MPSYRSDDRLVLFVVRIAGGANKNKMIPDELVEIGAVARCLVERRDVHP
jgi:hypothetical protein